MFAGYHYDLNFLTIHGRSRFPGLFIWLRDGRKVPVKVPAGCLLLQAGKQVFIVHFLIFFQFWWAVLHYASLVTGLVSLHSLKGLHCVCCTCETPIESCLELHVLLQFYLLLINVYVEQLEWLTGGECAAGMHEVVVSESTLKTVEASQKAGRSLWRVSSTVIFVPQILR